jgi:NifU-like protein
MSYYPDRIRDHFFNPRNVGVVEGETSSGDVGSLVCGAALRLSLGIDANTQRISEAKFKATGCGFLIASASVLTGMLKGMVLGEAARLTANEVLEELDGCVPQHKAHCVLLCLEAIQAAAVHYRETTLEEWTGEEALICTCFGVSEKSIERLVRTRLLRTVEQVTSACNAGGGCGSCRPLIEDILEDYLRTDGRRI